MESLNTFAEYRHAIGELQLFAGVSDPALPGLLADCAVLRVAAGEVVMNNNTAGGRLYILLRGALRATQPDLEGGPAETAGVCLLPGECVGELSVLDQQAQAATIQALQESDLLVIEAGRLWQLIDHSNGVARNLLHLLSFRIRAVNAQLRRRHRVGEFYRQMSLADGLTGLQNRAWLDQNLPLLIEQARVADNPLSVVMLDIDHFKKFNDEYGHQAGDEVLRVAAKVLTDTLRPRDFPVRYGGEELLVILPNTHGKGAAGVAQRLCDNLRSTVFFSDMHKALPHITASFGVASLAPDQDAGALIASADTALYRAKHAGRNQVALA
ncbi:GGDEF domain-containing protein [Janthinobacterium sp. 17J80-10]|uniref:GGDEF domain-containing protein n=1 Tax=Janthinobacterium sp. 17J80-10 TaxID=2497863 RepID=UPI0010056BCD|nr:GGDEF domain-containing protein [Janthinobacterium sp. 17J80-10]QAU35421.1 GGDEF domain-containing protein [Janthinobacterium sp. 17J80-10]